MCTKSLSLKEKEGNFKSRFLNHTSSFHNTGKNNLTPSSRSNGTEPYCKNANPVKIEQIGELFAFSINTNNDNIGQRKSSSFTEEMNCLLETVEGIGKNTCFVTLRKPNIPYNKKRYITTLNHVFNISCLQHCYFSSQNINLMSVALSFLHCLC